MNGFRLLRGTKKASPNTPLILTTGFAHFQKHVAAKITQADAFLKTPFAIRDFLDCIEGLLKRSRRRIV